MQNTNHYFCPCPICGLILLPDPKPSRSWPKLIHWLAQVRGIYKSDDRVAVTGVGLVRRGILSVSFNPNIADSSAEGMYGAWALQNRLGPNWAFGMHEACWQLLLCRFRGRIPTAEIATRLFNIFFFLPHVDRQERTIHKDRPLPGSDPGAVPTMEELEKMADPEPDDPDEGSIKWEIDLSTLDDDCLFPDFGTPVNYRRAVLGVRKCVQNGHPSLVNRKRIAKWVQSFAALIELDPRLPAEPGTAASTAVPQGHGRFRLSNTNKLVQVKQSVSGMLAPFEYRGPIMKGCRAQCYKMRTFSPLPDFESARIAVALIQLGQETYVSGIACAMSSEHAATEFRLGFIQNPDQTEYITIQPGNTLMSLVISTCEQGLRAVEVITEPGGSIGFAGEPIEKRTGFSRHVLDLPLPSQPCCMVAGFDRYKMVYFGIGDFVNTQYE
ncbi:hypothetical protein BJX61DRAFT_542278 [Aspergillus egyptiacus]|nr:hypothetical protein BJX61DRAFT_542278 [Aspergillus egyptiacus]